ncbi:MAG: hypothetical protein KF894_13945 [Labilithrix sp.]|nr:hypothetical protein [Labilithrix sp.]
MMLGRVDEVDGHFVATRFFAFVPTECLYVSPKSPRTSVAGATKDGVRIQTHWRSVGLGFARAWLPAIAIALPIAQIFLGGPQLAMIAMSVAMLAGSAFAHRAGRLPETEKARLRVLGTVTGLRIDPSKLQERTREVKSASLGELMDKGGIPMTPEGILSVLDEIPMPAMPLVYGYARYAGDDPEWRACADRCYERYLQGDI